MSSQSRVIHVTIRRDQYEWLDRQRPDDMTPLAHILRRVLDQAMQPSDTDDQARQQA